MRSHMVALDLRRILPVVFGLGVVACSSPGEVGRANGAGGAGGVTLTIPTGGTAHPSDPDSGTSGLTPTTDANCGNQATALTQLPADLLVVLDRSGSMTLDIASETLCDPPTASCTQRWKSILAGMTKVLASSPVSIDWGLKFFSTPGVSGAQGSTPEGCVVKPGVEVPIGKDSASGILQAISTATPSYNTPTRAALTTATAYLQTVSDNRPKYILLATDGEPNCALNGAYPTESDTAATLSAIDAALVAGIEVFVLGVGPSTGNLDQMAARGGTGHYYPALSPESLNSALATIAGIVASCAYDVGAIPPDPDNLGVYLDKNLVPRSQTDGWTMSGDQTVLFTGATCERIKAGTYKSVQVLFGCPGVSTIPAVIP